MSDNPDYIRLIHSSRWSAVRRYILTQHPICQDCQDQDRIAPAREVHHVVPAESAKNVDDMKVLMFDIHNLRALCHDCHVKRHRDMKQGSKQLHKQRTSEELERFKSKFFKN